MPDAPTLDALYHLLSHPAIAWFIAVCICVTAVVAIVRVVTAHNRTLGKGNDTLEAIQANMAVSTAHQAAGVETLRAMAVQVERIGVHVDNHDNKEEQRHRETLRELREGRADDRRDRES